MLRKGNVGDERYHTTKASFTTVTVVSCWSMPRLTQERMTLPTEAKPSAPRSTAPFMIENVEPVLTDPSSLPSPQSWTSSDGAEVWHHVTAWYLVRSARNVSPTANSSHSRAG